jgi:transaldolase
MTGLERRVAAGQSVDAIASVASFFVSRIDAKVDPLLPADSTGARAQRPLWASTGTKDPAYSDVLYVEELIAPDVINTMPAATLRGFADHGDPTRTLDRTAPRPRRRSAAPGTPASTCRP